MKHLISLLLLLAGPAFAAEHDHSAHTTEAAPAAPATPTAEHDHAAVSADPNPPVGAAPAAEHDHTSDTSEVAPAAVQDHSAAPTAPADTIVRDDSAAMQEARHMNLMMHGDSLNFLVLGERFEQAQDAGNTSRLWEAQGWLGYDRDKFWFKTEGRYDVDAGDTEHTEVQALYSRAIAPFWDVQAGVRRDASGSAARTHAVLGLMGLAPYWFEVDAAAFLSERGDLGARLETEYELRFTQKLLLQPRLELNYSFADDPALGIGKGLSEAVFGLRLRYEVRREFAPYLGVEWSRAYHNTAALLRAAGRDREELNFVAGLRFWY